MAFVNDGHVLTIYVQMTNRITQKYKPGSSRIFNVTGTDGTVHKPVVVEGQPHRKQEWVPEHARWVVPGLEDFDPALLVAALSDMDVDQDLIDAPLE